MSNEVQTHNNQV